MATFSVHGARAVRILVLAVLAAAGPATGWAGGVGIPVEDRVPSTEVVGGTAVTPGDWPDCAAVLFGADVGCTGVLIAPTVVLTAGHCIGGVTQVYLGTWDLTQPPGEAVDVVQEVAHPNWWSTYDVGVLILDTPSAVPPRMIAHGCAHDRIVDGASATVVGWGATDTWGTVGTTDLMEADMSLEDADCSDPALGCNPSVSPGGELVAGGGGVDSCFGDSGGPLYLRTPGQDLLVGITSRAVATSAVPCGDGGIYVRPDAIIPWIELQTGVTLPVPDCGLFLDGFESGDTSAWMSALP